MKLIDSKAHRLFLNMLNISAHNSKELIGYFIDAAEKLWPGAEFSHSFEKNNAARVFSLASEESDYGYICITNSELLDKKDQSLLQHAVYLLCSQILKIELDAPPVDDPINPPKNDAILLDIDKELKKTCYKQSILNSSEHLFNVFENTKDLQVLTRYEGKNTFRIVAVNKAYIRTLANYKKDITQKDLTGKTLQEVNQSILKVDEAVFETTIARYQKAIDLGETIHFEENAIIQDHSFYSQASLSPIYDSKNKRTYVLYLSHDVTGEQEIQNKLQKSEKKYRAVLENAAEGILVIQDQERKYYNPRWLDITGFTAAEYKSIPYLSLVHPDDKEALYHAYENTIAGKSFEKTLEFRLLTKSGKTAYINAKPAQTEWEGRPAVMIFLIDVSEKIQAEKKLRKSEHSLSTLINNVPGMVYSCKNDGSWTMTFVSDGAYNLTGYTPEELTLNTTISFGDLILAEDKDYVWNTIQRALENTEAFKLIYRIRHKNGEQKWVWERGCGVFSKKGTLRHLEGFITDITELKNAETNLKRSESLLNATQRLTQVGGWEWDVRKDVMYWTEETYRIHGFTAGDMEHSSSRLIQSSIACYDKKDQAIVMALFEKCAQEGIGYDQEFPFTSCRGERKWIRTTARAIKENDKIIKVIGNIIDITQQKQYETALKTNEARYKKAQALGHVGNWEYDIKTTHFWGSAEAKRIYGYNPDQDDFTTDEVESCIPERKRVHQALIDLIEKGKEYNLEFDIITKDKGERKTITSIAEVERNADGAPLKITGVITDITKRKQAQERQQLFSQILENSLNEIYLFDATTLKFLHVNTAAVKNLGYTAKQLLDMTPLDVKQQMTAQRFQKLLSPLRNGKKERIIFETVHQRKDKSLYDIEVHVQLLTYDNKELFAAFILDITERKQAEKKLQESKNRFDIAMNATNDGLYDWNLVTNEIYYSPGWKRMLGYKEHELPNDFSVWEKLTDAKDVQRSWKMQNELILKKRERFEIEFKMKHKKGHWVDIYSRATAIFNEADKAVRIVGTHMDISERKKMERILRHREENLRTIFQAADNVAIVTTNLGAEEARITNFSPGAEKIFGYRKNEILGQKVAKLHLPNSHKTLADMYEKIHRDERGYHGEITLVRKSGETFPALFNVQPLYNGEGTLIGRIGVTIDISEQKKTEKELRQSEQKFRALFEQSGGYCMILDPNTPDGIPIIVDANRAAYTVHGYTKEEFIGRPVGIVDDEEGKRKVKEHTALIMTGKPFYVENTHLRKDGTTFSVAVTAQRIDFNDGPPLIYSVEHDISERKKAEAELAQYREHLEELVESRTMELQTANDELEAFAYSVSHDLRAPLRAIDGFTRMLLEKYSSRLDSEAQRLGAVIHNNTQKMGRLINDLLAFSRLGRIEMNFSTIDMKNMAKAIYFETSSVDERARVDFNLADLPPATGDPNMMRQVWMNLISNALKFSGERTKIIISISYSKEQQKTIYCVKDNGAGFDMRYADKLFNVFQRLHSDEEFQGTGVGLALVQRIIHRHGGTTWAEAEEDAGATFYFSLPTHPQKM